MKIQICSHQYEFTEEEITEGWTNGLGRSDLRKGFIKIYAGLSPGTRESTILHEVIHQLADMNDLKTVTDSETTVSVLAVGLLDFLRRNPELARQICGT